MAESYSIGQVSEMTQLPQSVLRYWETVFPQLNPYKTAGGTRRYAEADIVTVRKIRELLYNRKFTIAGARQWLEVETGQARQARQQDILKEVIRELEEILDEIKN